MKVEKQFIKLLKDIGMRVTKMKINKVQQDTFHSTSIDNSTSNYRQFDVLNSFAHFCQYSYVCSNVQVKIYKLAKIQTPFLDLLAER